MWHITREKGKAFQVLKGKPEGKKPLGRPKHRGYMILKCIFKK